MEIRQVGVVGCGLMGTGIAQVVATAGFETTVVEANQQLCDRGISNIEKGLERMVRKATLSEEQKTAIRGRLRATTDQSQLSKCDLIIEAIIENLEEKAKLWRSLDSILKREAILASNTSSLSITEMMMATNRPERFVGMHFFNPVPVLELVEVVKTVATDPQVYETAVAFTQKLGKTPVRTSDRAGFIVNRLLVPYLLDAIRALEEGAGSITDIDKSMKLGCAHPMGPFTLLDFVGLDTTYYIANILFDEFREPRFAPPGLLKRLVKAGWHGRKTGKGFYDYSDPKAPKPLDQLQPL
ncbi:MAG: 3-hydroxybutyryl-CoA dehydrogenase [Acidobacteria bacterium]|nr:3-hydroxybutyryl-CoA dehydrogenase [Acidobacteriota bacterium]MCZ6753461.1 3-hydroxybutyryl-CoA dehydrogenase [Acidobacteriota bacterium]